MNEFPDLRPDHGGINASEESFWPSFADIMMVVVMIFLISTAFLVIRNSGLTQKLTQTLESERRAAEQARLRLEENMSLEDKLSALENLLSVAQLERMKSEQEKARLEKQLAELSDKLLRATNLSDVLQRKLNDKNREIQQTLERLDALEKESEQARKELAERSRELNARVAELAAARKSIAGLKHERERQALAIEQATAGKAMTEEALEKLRSDYLALESKYQKLVRPARTAKGKTVVSLRYRRENGNPIVELKLPGEDDFSEYSIKRMHEILADLKQQYGKKLYIRIIFPDNSDLTYKDAWKFTNEILSKYDYYYQ